MSMPDKKVEEFIEEQFKILEKANNEVRANVIKIHEDHCKDKNKDCLEAFLDVCNLAIEARILQEEFEGPSKPEPTLN